MDPPRRLVPPGRLFLRKISWLKRTGSTMLWPTNPTLIVALALAGVPWTRWARFMVPLQLLFLAAGFASLAVAVAIGWGPF